MLISRNTLDNIYEDIDNIDVVIYDFVGSYSELEEHSILVFQYDDFMTYKAFNFNFIVIYDKNQKAMKDISQITSENWNLLKVISNIDKYSDLRRKEILKFGLDYDVMEMEQESQLVPISNTSLKKLVENKNLCKYSDKLNYIQSRKFDYINFIENSIDRLEEKIIEYKSNKPIDLTLAQELERKYLKKTAEDSELKNTNNNKEDIEKIDRELKSLSKLLIEIKEILETKRKSKVLDNKNNEYNKYIFNLNEIDNILNIDDTISTIDKKLNSFTKHPNIKEPKKGKIITDKVEIITLQEEFFLKNDANSIIFIFNLEVEEQFNLIQNRLNKLRKESSFIEDIKTIESSKDYKKIFKDLLGVNKKYLFREKFNKIVKDLYDDKINSIIDNRKTRETYRVEILDKMVELKMIGMHELYYFYTLNEDDITSRFRQNNFTKESKEIILRYLKSQKIEEVNTSMYLNTYQDKLSSLKQSDKKITKKEVDYLHELDYEFIVNQKNKTLIIKKLTAINNNEKKSKSIYTKLIREFLFTNLYRLEYDYTNTLVDYRIDDIDIYTQKERKRELIRMTSEKILSDLLEYVKNLIPYIEELIEDKKESLIYQFDGITCLENNEDIPYGSNIECFGFIRKIPLLNEDSTKEELLDIISALENNNIDYFCEYSMPYIVN